MRYPYILTTTKKQELVKAKLTKQGKFKNNKKKKSKSGKDYGNPKNYIEAQVDT